MWVKKIFSRKKTHGKKQHSENKGANEKKEKILEDSEPNNSDENKNNVADIWMSRNDLGIMHNDSSDEGKGLGPITFFKRLLLIRRTFEKLRSRTSYRKMRFMTLKEFDLIKDKTHFTRAEDRLGILDFLKPRQKGGMFIFKSSFELGFLVFFKTFGKAFHFFEERLLQKLPTVKPNGLFKIIWDILIIFFVLMKMFIIPLELSFGIKMQTHVDSSFGLLNFITSCFFLLDIVLKMNTGYFEGGEMVLNKSLIIRHYFKSFFFMDLLASVHSAKYLYEYNTYLQGLKPSSSVSFLHFFFFFKIVELAHVVTTLEEAVYMGRNLEFLYETIKLLVKVLLFNHLIACVWHAVAYYNHTTETWIEGADLENAEWFDKYLHSYFWAVCALTSHHYGEKVSPRSRSELQVATLILLLSSGLFVFIIKDLGEILQNFLEKKTMHRKKIKILNKFMKRKGIAFHLQERARKYLNFYLTDMDNLHAKEEADILKTFSTSLREEIYSNTFGNILKNIGCIENNFSEEFKKKLVFSLKQINFQPEEIIFSEDSHDDNNIYFVHDGRVDIIKGKTAGCNTTICSLMSDDTFGQEEFFSNEKREFTAKSMSFGTCFMVEKNEFMEIIKDFPQDFEKFCMIRDKICIYKSYDIMNPKCYACGRKGHIYDECKRVHFIPDKEFLIKKYQYSEPHFSRKIFNRKRKKKFNTRANLKRVTNDVNEYLEKASFLNQSSDEQSYTFEKELDFEDNNMESNINTPSKNDVPNTQDEFHDESFLRSKYENIRENIPKSLFQMQLTELQVNKQLLTFGSIPKNKAFFQEEEYNKMPSCSEGGGKMPSSFKFSNNSHNQPIFRDIELFRTRSNNNTNNNNTISTKKQTEENIALIQEPSVNNKELQTLKSKSHPPLEKPIPAPQFLAHPEEEGDDIHLKGLQLYMFGFDGLSTYQNYFPEGNYERITNIIMKKSLKSHSKVRVSRKSFRDDDLSPAQKIRLKKKRMSLVQNGLNLTKI